VVRIVWTGVEMWESGANEGSGFFRGYLKNCPAGRAHCAWGGHFVAGIPVEVGLAAEVLPLVGIIIFSTIFILKGEIWL
jgi:hypothetical protein